METNVGVLPLDQWRIVKEIHFDYQWIKDAPKRKILSGAGKSFSCWYIYILKR